MIYEIIGYSGAVAILLAYFLVSIGRVSHSSMRYQLLNLLGALGVLINAGVHGAIPSVMLNVIWLSIALYGIFETGR